MNSVTLICIWILAFPIGIIQVSTSRKCCFWLYFSPLHHYWPPNTWHYSVHTSWGEMERCEKRAFQLFKMYKKISCNIKNQCVSDFLFTVRSSNMKDYTFHYVMSTYKTNVYIKFNKNNGNLEIICLQVTGYFNTRKSFPICMFNVMASGKCDLRIHFNYLHEF